MFNIYNKPICKSIITQIGPCNEYLYELNFMTFLWQYNIAFMIVHKHNLKVWFKLFSFFRA